MSLLVYAIADGPPQVTAPASGVGASTVSCVGAPGLVALVSEHERAPALTEAALWAFDEVIESQMADRAVLPARFGSMVEDRPALEALLDERRDQLTAQLETVRGAVELGVRASWRQDPAAFPPRPSTGASYMLDRVAVNRREQELGERIDAHLRPLARAAGRRLAARPGVPVSIAYLIDRGRLEEFIAKFSELETVIEGADLVCTGPWPPYSFAGEPADG